MEMGPQEDTVFQAWYPISQKGTEKAWNLMLATIDQESFPLTTRNKKCKLTWQEPQAKRGKKLTLELGDNITTTPLV